MSAPEVNIIRPPSEWEFASGTVGRSSEAMKLRVKIPGLYPLQAAMDKILSQIQDIDSMGQITENINKSLSHLPSHIKIGILTLKKLDSMLNRAICSQILNDLSVDIKEYLDFIWRQI